MRTVAIALVLLAVAAAGGAWALSALINAEDLRDQLVREVEAVTGAPVTVQGRVDFSILPQPTLTLAGARISPAGSSVRLDVDRVDLEVKPLALLRGDVEVDEVRLVRPVLELHAAQGGVPALSAWLQKDRLLAPPAGALSRLVIVDGRAVMAGAGEPTPRTFERIDLELEAQSERGPFTVSGALSAGEERFTVAARIGRLSGDGSTTLQAELAAVPAGATPLRLTYRGLVSTGTVGDLRGQVTLAGEDARKGIGLIAAALGRAPPALPGWLAHAYEISGTLRSAAGHIQVSELHLALAGHEALGRLELTAGAAPAIDLGLTIPSLELARPLPSDGLNSAPLVELASWLRGDINLTFGRIGWRGEAARQVRLTLALSGTGDVLIEQARATLPGDADASFEGRLERGGLEGSLVAVTDQLRALLRWFQLDPAGVPPERLRSLSLATRIALRDQTLRLTGTDLRLDASRLTGSLALDLGGRARLAAVLALDRLDLDDYLPQASTETATDALRAWLADNDLAVRAEVERLSWGELRWSEVAFDGRAVNALVTLNRLRARAVTDAIIQLTGTIDLRNEAFDLRGELDAPRPALLFRRLGFKPPIALSRLTGLQIQGSAEGWQDAASLDLALELEDIRARMRGDVHWEDALTYELDVQLSHPRYVALMEKLGVLQQPLEGEPSGPLSLEGKLKSTPETAFALVGHAALGETRMTGEVAWQDVSPRPRLRALLSLGDPELDTLLPLMRFSELRLDPAVLAGPVVGNWPQQEVAFDWLRRFDAELEVSGKGGLAGTGMELQASLEDGLLMVERFALGVFGGALELEASLNVRRQLPFAALALRLTGASPADVARWFDLAPVLEGEGELYGEATATGRSPFELLRTLTGELALNVRNGRLLLGAAAAPKATRAATQGPLDAAPREGALALSALEAQFDLRRGIAQVRSASMDLADAGGRIEGLVDLLLWVADLTVVIEPEAQPAQADGGMILKVVGPLARPQVIRQSPPADAAPAGEEGPPRPPP